MAQLENEAEATAEISARFLAQVATSIAKDPQSTHARTALPLNVLKHLTSTSLAIHTLAPGFDTETRKTVLSACFQAVAALQLAPVPTQPASALLTAASSGKASIFALFGDQGTNEVYLDEPRTSMTFMHLLSRRSRQRLPRTSLFPSLKSKATLHSILTAST